LRFNLAGPGWGTLLSVMAAGMWRGEVKSETEYGVLEH
jgi:hypothetical protein